MLLVKMKDGTERSFGKGTYPYVNSGDLVVLKEERRQNKTVACFASGVWAEVDVIED